MLQIISDVLRAALMQDSVDQLGFYVSLTDSHKFTTQCELMRSDELISKAELYRAAEKMEQGRINSQYGLVS